MTRKKETSIQYLVTLYLARTVLNKQSKQREDKQVVKAGQIFDKRIRIVAVCNVWHGSSRASSPLSLHLSPSSVRGSRCAFHSLPSVQPIRKQ